MQSKHDVHEPSRMSGDESGDESFCETRNGSVNKSDFWSGFWSGFWSENASTSESVLCVHTPIHEKTNGGSRIHGMRFSQPIDETNGWLMNDDDVVMERSQQPSLAIWQCALRPNGLRFCDSLVSQHYGFDEHEMRFWSGSGSRRSSWSWQEE